MNTEDMIDVTAADPVALIKEAYALSSPQGLGFIHAQDGPLSDDDARAILEREPHGRGIIARMDYVKGRSCKFTIFQDMTDGRRWIRSKWHDHSESQLRELLSRCGVTS